MEVLKSQRTPVTDEQLEALKTFPFENIWNVMKRLGYTTYFTGLKSTRPGTRMVGRALTIQYLPRRPDLNEATKTLAKEGDWPEMYNVRAAEDAKPGDVLVVDMGGELTDGVFFGDVSALGAQVAGAHGAVFYGSSRDYGELKDMKDFPVFALGYDPNVAVQVGIGWNVPIRVGNITVLPGDVVVADDEAVMFFPPQLAGEIVKGAQQITDQEIYERNLVSQKKYRFRDVYPLNPELHKQYEEEQKKKQQNP
jgi:regulator of RNase E activity RraA